MEDISYMWRNEDYQKKNPFHRCGSDLVLVI